VSGSAKDVASRFRRTAGVAAVSPAPALAPSPAARAGLSKYTVLFAAAETDVLDEFQLRAKRELHRRVDKSEVLRVLVAMVGDDEALARDVLDRLRGAAL
jgi:S1-C subfamily serine protease